MSENIKSEKLKKILEQVDFVEHEQLMFLSDVLLSKDKECGIQATGYEGADLRFYRKISKISDYYPTDFETWFNFLSEAQQFEVIMNLDLFK